jgi:uncharacterized C2H2 Zn-finger protein
MRASHPEMSDLAVAFKSDAKLRVQRSHACSICRRTFTRTFARIAHERSHRGERPHQCPECGEAFTRQNDCMRHQKLHERTGIPKTVPKDSGIHEQSECSGTVSEAPREDEWSAILEPGFEDSGDEFDRASAWTLETYETTGTVFSEPPSPSKS